MIEKNKETKKTFFPILRPGHDPEAAVSAFSRRGFGFPSPEELFVSPQYCILTFYRVPSFVRAMKWREGPRHGKVDAVTVSFC